MTVEIFYKNLNTWRPYPFPGQENIDSIKNVKRIKVNGSTVYSVWEE